MNNSNFVWDAQIRTNGSWLPLCAYLFSSCEDAENAIDNYIKKNPSLSVAFRIFPSISIKK